jgi:hypothetical protein
MVSNKPPTLGWQLDRCDVCGDKIHRSDLVRTQVEFLDLKAENYLSYSSYDSSYWSVDTASDAGNIYGNRADNARYAALTDSYTDTYFNAVQTWTGSGTLRMDDEVGAFSTASDLTFSAQVGPHEQNTSPEMTVVLGITNAAGDSKQALKTYTISGTTRVWVNAEVATLNTYGLGDGSFRFYIQVTNAGSWWADEMQLEANVNSMPLQTGHPENFVRTSGALVSNQADRQLVTQRKVCPSCAEYVLSKSERFGRTDESPVDEPVDTWSQEF